MSNKDLSEVVSKQERELNATFKLVERLSNIAKGNNIEVDNKLVKLRKNFNNAEVNLLDEIQSSADSVKKLERIQSDSVQELINTLIAAGEALQKSKGLDDGVRRQLRMVVNKLKSDAPKVFPELQPLVINLLSIFQAAKLGAVSSQSANGGSGSTSPNDIDQKVISTLVDGLKSLSNNDIIVPSLNEFNQQIDIAESDSQRLETCLKSFSKIVVQFGEEYKQTQKLILNINVALEGVHKTLLQSIKSSQAFNEQLQELNDKIDRQINDLSESATEAESIGELQNIVSQKLDIITESIKEKDGIEKRRTDELDSTLQAMESKLTQLEERTEFYRKKWLEEKNRSHTDSLTNLPNRGAYDKRFDEEIQRWLRQPSPLCVAVLDIDHFKKINDNYGHTVGDKTLQVVSKTIKANMRSTDFLARYGGEEFVCLMPNTDPKEALTPLEKVRKAVESIPFRLKEDRINITISSGFTMLKASDNVHTAFERADKALYEAKDTGRNRVCYKK